MNPFGTTLKYFSVDHVPVRWLDPMRMPEALYGTDWVPYTNVPKLRYCGRVLSDEAFTQLVGDSMQAYQASGHMLPPYQVGYFGWDYDPLQGER